MMMIQIGLVEQQIMQAGSVKGRAVRRAVRDMKKDRIFERYQYFIGGKPDLEYDEDIDGAFFRK